MTPEQEELTAFLRANGIEHFDGLEVVTLRRSGKVADVPRKSWWPRIIPALQVAEHIREQLGHALIIGNGYRPEPLNRQCGGSRGSRHVQFRALDLDLPSRYNNRDSQELLYRLAAMVYLNDGRRSKMGLGIYRPNRGPRIHIDCGSRHRCWGGPRKRWVRDLLDELR